MHRLASADSFRHILIADESEKERHKSAIVQKPHCYHERMHDSCMHGPNMIMKKSRTTAVNMHDNRGGCPEKKARCMAAFLMQQTYDHCYNKMMPLHVKPALSLLQKNQSETSIYK